jgi:transposase
VYEKFLQNLEAMSDAALEAQPELAEELNKRRDEKERLLGLAEELNKQMIEEARPLDASRHAASEEEVERLSEAQHAAGHAYVGVLVKGEDNLRAFCKAPTS